MKDKHIEINELISKYHKEWTLDKNLISDKYHTIWELYKHRIHLFIALMKAKIQLNKWNWDLVDRIIKSKKHFDWSEFEWWFIIQYNRCCYDWSKIWYDNQISYHLPNEYWDKCKFIQTVEKANEWDLHNSDDVLDRLLLI
jgi:hypothetical protein